MPEKKYNEFPAGTYDTAKIFLQADPTTGELEKVNLPSSGEIFGLTDQTADSDRVFNLDGNAFILEKDEDADFNFLSLSSIGNANLLEITGWTNNGYSSHLRFNGPVVELLAQLQGATGNLNIDTTKLNIGFSLIGDTGLTMDADGISVATTGQLVLKQDLLVIPSIPSYASNSLAVSAGLSDGSVYRQGDFLAIVHS